MTCQNNDWSIATAKGQDSSNMGMSQSMISDGVTNDEVTLCPESLAIAFPCVLKKFCRVPTVIMHRSQT